MREAEGSWKAHKKGVETGVNKNLTGGRQQPGGKQEEEGCLTHTGHASAYEGLS